MIGVPTIRALRRPRESFPILGPSHSQAHNMIDLARLKLAGLDLSRGEGQAGRGCTKAAAANPDAGIFACVLHPATTASLPTMGGLLQLPEFIITIRPRIIDRHFLIGAGRWLRSGRPRHGGPHFFQPRQIPAQGKTIKRRYLDRIVADTRVKKRGGVLIDITANACSHLAAKLRREVGAGRMQHHFGWDRLAPKTTRSKDGIHWAITGGLRLRGIVALKNFDVSRVLGNLALKDGKLICRGAEGIGAWGCRFSLIAPQLH